MILERYYKHFILIPILTVFLGGINAFAAKAKMDILSQVYVEHEQIFLNDITKTENVSEDLKAKLNAIVIGDAPKDGETRSFSSYAISEIIRYNLKSDLQQITLKIPSEIKVSRKGANLTPQEVKTKMTAWVQSTCEPCEIEINSLRLQDPGKLDASVTWSISNLQIIPRGNFNIALDLYKNNNFFKKIYVQGNLRILKEVPVVKRNLQYGERVQREDVSFEKRDITFNREAIPTLEELYGSEIAGSVSVSQIIWTRNLKRKMALTRGAPVQVTVQNQGWKINITGISQDSGYVGDTVKVLNPDTKKIIIGVINSSGMVEVR